MRFRTLLASTVIGMTTLTATGPSMAQTQTPNPVVQATARLDAQYAAWNARAERTTTANIAAINRVAPTNPAGAIAVANRAKAAIRATADRSIAAANRSQAATTARLNKMQDPESRIQSLGAHHARFNALVNLRASQYITQIDNAVNAATGG